MYYNHYAWGVSMPLSDEVLLDHIDIRENYDFYLQYMPEEYISIPF